MIDRRVLLAGGVAAAVAGVGGTVAFLARRAPASGDKPAVGGPAGAGSVAASAAKPTVTVHRPPT